MRILWITNTIFPNPSIALGLPVPVVGGWMYGLAEQLASRREITLAVATVYQGSDLKCLDLNGILYYLLPNKVSLSYQKHLEPLWKNICSEFLPDIVHIHGTENKHGISCMRACQTLKFVVSIQGLVGVYARYYYAGLSVIDIIKNITLRDVFRHDNIFDAKKNFLKKGIIEQEYIIRAKHVIGRTEWDFAHSLAINPVIKYHYCNETLRNGFYKSFKWDCKKKTDYTIFLSQASYPIKGLHQVIKAVAILVKTYPQINLRVAGHNIINKKTLLSSLKINGYGSYVASLIKKYKLDKCIVFVGVLSEEQIIKEYLNAHLFICPSSIENSANSIGEAQILGVPTIASYVGGTPDLIASGETGLMYRFEEIEMLVENIKKIFSDTSLSQHLSEEGIKIAENRHSLKLNSEQTLRIYKSIL